MDLQFRGTMDLAQFGLGPRQIPNCLKAEGGNDTEIDTRKFLVALGERGFLLPGGGAKKFREHCASGAWTDDPAMRYVWLFTEYALDGGFVIGWPAIGAALGVSADHARNKWPEARARVRWADKLPVLSNSDILELRQERISRHSGRFKTAPGRKRARLL